MKLKPVFFIIAATWIFSAFSQEPSDLEKAYNSMKKSEFEAYLDTVNVNSDEAIACRSYYEAIMSDNSEQTVFLLETMKNLFSETKYGQKAMLELSRYYILKRDYEKASALLNSINNPDLSEKNFYLSHIRLKRKKYEESVITAQNFIKSSDDATKKEQAYIFIAESYIKLKKFTRALNTLQYLKKSELLKNCAPLCQFKIGFAYEMSGNYKQAATEYKKVISDFSYTKYSFEAEERIRNMKKDNAANTGKAAETEEPETSETKNEKTVSNAKKDSPKVLKFYLQAGAFGSKRNADKLAKKIMGKGYPAAVFPKILKGKELQVVAAGPFEKKQQAKTAKEKLLKEDIRSFIIKRY
ncbi:MAG: hypothetical protein CSB55_06330 [Candidatus Cloacimonadota bacterium]|nr:MAG: hypothetical protein CSB55_06330 [Candidatus Cloacimonadota bacterium]